MGTPRNISAVYNSWQAGQLFRAVPGHGGNHPRCVLAGGLIDLFQTGTRDQSHVL